MAKIKDTDVFLISRDGANYKAESRVVSSKLRDTDYMVVLRGSTHYKVLGQDIKSDLNPPGVQPQPSDVTSPGFVGGTGTQGDPYIMETAVTAPYGTNAESAWPININGQRGELVNIVDTNTSIHGSRFDQYLGAIPESGTYSTYLYFTDTPFSTQDITYTALFLLGGVYIQWSVDVLEGLTPVAVNVTINKKAGQGTGVSDRTYELTATLTDDGVPVATNLVNWKITGNLVQELDIGAITTTGASTKQLFSNRSINNLSDWDGVHNGHNPNINPGGQANSDMNAILNGRSTTYSGPSSGNTVQRPTVWSISKWSEPLPLDLEIRVRRDTRIDNDSIWLQWFNNYTTGNTPWKYSWPGDPSDPTVFSWSRSFLKGSYGFAIQYLASDQAGNAYFDGMRILSTGEQIYDGNVNTTQLNLVEGADFSSVAVTDTVKGKTSGATGTILSKAAGQVEVYTTSGTFLNGEPLVMDKRMASSSLWVVTNNAGGVTDLTASSTNNAILSTGSLTRSMEVAFPTTLPNGMTYNDAIPSGTLTDITYTATNVKGNDSVITTDFDTWAGA